MNGFLPLMSQIYTWKVGNSLTPLNVSTAVNAGGKGLHIGGKVNKLSAKAFTTTVTSCGLGGTSRCNVCLMCKK